MARHWYEKEADRQERVRKRWFADEAKEVAEKAVGGKLEAEEPRLDMGHGVSRPVREADHKTRRATLSCGHVKKYKSRRGPPEWMSCDVCTAKAREAVNRMRVNKIIRKARLEEVDDVGSK